MQMLYQTEPNDREALWLSDAVGHGCLSKCAVLLFDGSGQVRCSQKLLVGSACRES